MRLRRAWFIDTLREWGWRHTGLGLLVGSLALFNMGNLLFFPPSFPFARSWVYNVFEFGLPLVFAIRVADRAVADGASRWLAYGSAVVGVIVLGVWLIGPLMSPVIGGDPDWTVADDVSLAFSLLLPFAIATVAYAHWRRECDTLDRLHAAELVRARQEQVVQSARLLALQARVEPQFLFDTLARVRNLIGSSTDAAERLLGDLIALLRALQPAAGATASSVEREFALVQAYARASEAPALQAPRLQMQADEAAAPARMAPLLLLPTLRGLIGNAPNAGWQVSATRSGERLRLLIAPGMDLPNALTALLSLDTAPLQQRLTAVHGRDATLAVSTVGAPALQIDLPFQADDPRPDR